MGSISSSVHSALLTRLNIRAMHKDVFINTVWQWDRSDGHDLHDAVSETELNILDGNVDGQTKALMRRHLVSIHQENLEAR